MPQFILRDPPGDQSYSYIESGSTFEDKITITDGLGGSVGFKADLSGTIVGIGAFTESSIGGAWSAGQSNAYILSTTTTQRMETAADSRLEHNFVTGNQGDVIVGTGISTAYGIVEIISQDENDCSTFRKSRQIQIAPTGLTTGWHYSVFQIEKLIDEYNQQLVDIQSGTLTLEGKETDEAIRYVEILKKNWGAVLEYHTTESVPMCKICDLSTIPRGPNGGPINYLSSLLNDKLEEEVFKAFMDFPQYQRFCSKLGGFDNCELAEFEWTDELMSDYNTVIQLRQNIANWIEYDLLSQMSYEAKDLSLDELLIDYLIIPGTSQIITFIDFYLLIEREVASLVNNVQVNGTHGLPAKNITFDGTTGPISNEVTVINTESRSIIQEQYFDTETWSGVANTTELSFEAFITSTETVDLDNRVGITGSLNIKLEHIDDNTVENVSTTGYVLDDDDAGDQFSVTVVKGIDPSHTPYFSLLGGRSSCPYEPGTISRYNPQLFIELEDGSLTQEAELFNVPVDKPGSFRLLMSNGNLFGEGLFYHLWAPTGANPNVEDAQIFFEGGESEDARQLFPEVPQYTQVDIIRREGDVYDYDDIMLSLAPECEMPIPTIADTVLLKVHFQQPCSPISLVTDGNKDQFGSGTQDGDQWVINKAPQGEPEQLLLKLIDYDLLYLPLESITIQYRRLGSNNWYDIETLERQTLVDFYEENLVTFPNATYPYIWDITNRVDIADGDYEIRAQTFCTGSQENYSNVLTGVIDRTSMLLFGSPQPQDGILSLGDEISVSFNEQIDCALFQDSMVTLKKESDGTAVPFSTACFNYQVKLVIEKDVLIALEGETLLASISGIEDNYGNILPAPVNWSFLVHQNPVLWFPDGLELTVIQGETVQGEAHLYNTSDDQQAFSLRKNTNWLDVSVENGVIPSFGLESGLALEGAQHLELGLTVDATALEVGTYEDILNAAVPGFGDEPFNLTVTVLEVPPVPDVVDFVLSGEVVDASGAAVNDAEIKLHSISDGTFTVIATTILSGNNLFQFSGLSAGNYAVEVVPGVDVEALYLTTYSGDKTSLGDAEQLVLDANKSITITMIDKPQQQGNGGEGVVSSTITDAEGNPLAGVDVFLLDSDGNVVGFATTDENGQFTIFGLSPGNYTLSVDYEGLALKGASIDVSNDGKPVVLDITVTPDGLVTTIVEATAIEDSFTGSVSVYPVPSSDIVNISLDRPTGVEYKLDLISIRGELILTHKSKAKLVSLDISDISRGTYFVMISDEKQIIFKRLIKE